MNEFLAYSSSHSCKKKILIGGKSDSFLLCFDEAAKSFNNNNFNVSSNTTTFRPV